MILFRVTIWRRLAIAGICFFIVKEALAQHEPVGVIVFGVIGLIAVATALRVAWLKWSTTLCP